MIYCPSLQSDILISLSESVFVRPFRFAHVAHFGGKLELIFPLFSALPVVSLTAKFRVESCVKQAVFRGHTAVAEAIRNLQ